MVNERVNIRDKHRLAKKMAITLGIIIILVLILGGAFMLGLFNGKKVEIIIENPLKNIVLSSNSARSKRFP